MPALAHLFISDADSELAPSNEASVPIPSHSTGRIGQTKPQIAIAASVPLGRAQSACLSHLAERLVPPHLREGSSWREGFATLTETPSQQGCGAAWSGDMMEKHGTGWKVNPVLLKPEVNSCTRRKAPMVQRDLRASEAAGPPSRLCLLCCPSSHCLTFFLSALWRGSTQTSRADSWSVGWTSLASSRHPSCTGLQVPWASLPTSRLLALLHPHPWWPVLHPLLCGLHIRVYPERCSMIHLGHLLCSPPLATGGN